MWIKSERWSGHARDDGNNDERCSVETRSRPRCPEYGRESSRDGFGARSNESSEQYEFEFGDDGPRRDEVPCRRIGDATLRDCRKRFFCVHGSCSKDEISLRWTSTVGRLRRLGERDDGSGRDDESSLRRAGTVRGDCRSDDGPCGDDESSRKLSSGGGRIAREPFSKS